MPKLLVLFFGAEEPASTLADFAADGAATVRFTEVDVRAGAAHQLSTGKRRKVLESVDRVADYHGVVFSAPAAGEIPAELDALLAELERRVPPTEFSNTVFAAIGGDNTTLLGHLSRLGGIIVSEPRGYADPEARARATGARVAKVVEWVRHALGHEHQHANGHGHGDHEGHGHKH